MSEWLQAMTEAEYLAWEEGQERPYEFDGLRPVAMTGATNRHERIQGNLKFALMSRLRGERCEPFGPNTRIATGQGRYRYPDAVVTCSAQDELARGVTEPVVIFEIISESTFEVDRKVKLMEYCAMPSVARYVILEQDEALATIIARDGDHWQLDFRRAGQVIEMPEIGISLPLDEVYERVDFSAAPG